MVLLEHEEVLDLQNLLGLGVHPSTHLFTTLIHAK